MNLIEPILEIEKVKLKKSPFRIFIDAGKNIVKKSKDVTANISSGFSKKE